MGASSDYFAIWCNKLFFDSFLTCGARANIVIVVVTINVEVMLDMVIHFKTSSPEI